MAEFNLSKEIQDCDFIPTNEVICIEDVKEFIKKVKGELSNTKVSPHKIYKKPHEIYDICIKIIDKFAGKELR